MLLAVICAVLALQLNGVAALPATSSDGGPVVFWAACRGADGTAQGVPPCGILSQPLSQPNAKATVVYIPPSPWQVTRLAVGDQYLCVGRARGPGRARWQQLAGVTRTVRTSVLR